MVSEWGEPDKSLQAGFDMDFLLHFGPSHYNDLFRCEEPYFSSRGKGSAAAFVENYKESRKKAGEKGLICIPSGNHDMDRLARVLHGDELKVAFAFLLTMPGAPFIYYGDEIGLRYVENLVSVEGGYNRTGSRSPMQWNHEVNFGFSNASPEKLYIPTDDKPNSPTVEDQMKDPNSLYYEVKKLIALRREHSALLSDGNIEFVSDGADGSPLAYIRSSADEKILVVVNPADREAVLTVPGSWQQNLYQIGGRSGRREW